MPRNAGQFVALGVTQFRSTVSDAMGRGNELAHALLGIENNSGYWAPDKLGAIVHSSPTRAPQIALAVVVGGIESHVTKDTWRRPTGIARREMLFSTCWHTHLLSSRRVCQNDHHWWFFDRANRWASNSR